MIASFTIDVTTKVYQRMNAGGGIPPLTQPPPAPT